VVSGSGISSPMSLGKTLRSTHHAMWHQSTSYGRRVAQNTISQACAIMQRGGAVKGGVNCVIMCGTRPRHARTVAAAARATRCAKTYALNVRTLASVTSPRCENASAS
jgi:hypothetical protein